MFLTTEFDDGFGYAKHHLAISSYHELAEALSLKMVQITDARRRDIFPTSWMRRVRRIIEKKEKEVLRRAPLGKQLVSAIQNEMSKVGAYSRGGALLVYVPHGLIGHNPYFFIPPVNTKIVLECRMTSNVQVFFEVSVEAITDFSSPLRETIPTPFDETRTVRRVSNLHISVSQSPVFIQHAVLLGHFTQRFLMTTCLSELGEMTTHDFISLPRKTSVLQTCVPRI